MFKEMRRINRQISDEEVRSILVKCEYGYPYSTSLSYVYHNNAIYFHCAREGQKLINIDNNNKVAFSIVGNTEVLQSKFSTRYESIILFGKATIVEAEEKEIALYKLIEKYSNEFLEEGNVYISKAKDVTTVIKIDIEHITGKSIR